MCVCASKIFVIKPQDWPFTCLYRHREWKRAMDTKWKKIAKVFSRRLTVVSNITWRKIYFCRQYKMSLVLHFFFVFVLFNQNFVWFFFVNFFRVRSGFGVCVFLYHQKCVMSSHFDWMHTKCVIIQFYCSTMSSCSYWTWMHLNSFVRIHNWFISIRDADFGSRFRCKCVRDRALTFMLSSFDDAIMVFFYWISSFFLLKLQHDQVITLYFYCLFVPFRYITEVIPKNIHLTIVNWHRYTYKLQTYNRLPI